MSGLAKQLNKTLKKRLEAAEQNVIESQAKIIVLDIERMKGEAHVEFWDLGDYKNRRIHADDVIRWPRTICAAWNWYGTEEMHFASEWGDGKRKMLKAIWDAVDQADIVVGHNIVGFDIKKLNSEWRDVGFAPPTPYKTVDTLAVARREFGDESRTLDALNRRLNIDAKTDKYDVDVARAALAGDVDAQLKLQMYNEGDIVAELELYNRLRGWMPNHPHMGPLDPLNKRCNQCNGSNIHPNGTYLAQQIRYLQYRCHDCGGNLRGSRHSRAAETRGVR